MGRSLVLSGALAAAIALACLAAPAAAAPAVEASVAPVEGVLESRIIDQLNSVRADPARFAKLLSATPGLGKSDEAIAFLRQQPPRGPLAHDPRLAQAAARHAAEQGRLGLASHVGQDGSHPRDRMLANGVFTTVYAELISFGQRRADDVVTQLVIDPPGPAHPHRLDIFDPLLTAAGVACGPNKTFGFMCVVDLSATPMTRGEPASPTVQVALQSGSSTHFVPGEVVAEFSGIVPPDRLQALLSGSRLEAQGRFTSTLSGNTFVLLHIPDQRAPNDVIRDLGGEAGLVGAQPNFLFDLMADAPAAPDGVQYAAEKLRLGQAHQLARGDKVLVGVVDAGVDPAHPELKGAIAASFDAVGGAARPDSHGTAIAALIAAHGRLTGSAPGARLLTARAFRQGGASQGASFDILKAVDWTAAHGARVINMSFSGPQDPALHRLLAAAAAKGVVLVAAAGNAGPASPPLYPAADPAVIAVTATDAQDRLYAGSNTGAYIGLAAPGVEILTAAPQGSYQVSTGTSLAAAEVSGVVALMLERRPGLTPVQVRRALGETARPLLARAGGPGLVDAYRATAAAAPGPGPPPRR